MSATIAPTAQTAATLRTAAYGAVSLIAAAGATHKGISQGTIALTSATGLTGHILSTKSRDIKLPGKSVAALAAHVLPALTASVTLLAEQDPAEAANFRDTVLVAVEAAARAGNPTPAVTAIANKIVAALAI